VQKANCDIGLVGLGVMGRNLALNIADRGFAIAGYNRHPDKVTLLEREAGERTVLGVRTVESLVSALRKPRAVMMMVPAGEAVDEVIRELLEYLDPGDLIVDGGNSHYKDTDIRGKALSQRGIQFLGVGISGGEKGARFGPSMMPGGPLNAYEQVRKIFEAIAAQFRGEPCVTYLGTGSSGHYVKTVHNGIEYGLMQLISETYDIMKRALGMNNAELAEIYRTWNQGELQSFLVEITADIFRRIDEKTGETLVDKILDRARQKGTGKWTSQDAMDLQVPMPTIDMAVMMRDLSAYKEERTAAERDLTGPAPRYEGDRNTFVTMLARAFHAAMIMTYTQGMALLRAASEAYHYALRLDEVARVWQGGCIIRARLLESVRSAFQSQPDLPNLLFDPRLAEMVIQRQDDLRKVVQTGVERGIPVPGFMASLAYFDGFRSGRLPANLIQAQRDYFGSHTYERIDEEGVFHTEWDEV
jgi:6-phosphogluconate dehydrogenase